MRFCEQNFFENFLTLFSMFLASLVESWAVEALNLPKVFFSLRTSYKFRMFISRTTASPKTESMHARLLPLTIGVSTKKHQPNWRYFLGYFCNARKKHSVSTWLILESFSSKFNKLNILILFWHACRFKI